MVSGGMAAGTTVIRLDVVPANRAELAVIICPLPVEEAAIETFTKVVLTATTALAGTVRGGPTADNGTVVWSAIRSCVLGRRRTVNVFPTDCEAEKLSNTHEF